MLRRFSVPAVAVCLLLMAAQARAQFQQGDWALQLGGVGNNSSDFDGVAFSVQGDLAYFLTNEFSLSLRQSIGYSDFTGGEDGGGSAWAASTRVAADYHFDMGRWQPYVGGNLGYIYGDGVSDTFHAGPEGGVKYFVNSTTFINFSIEYQFFFDEGEDEELDDGQFVYGLNIGFRWR
jgi:outer membrane protein W